MYNLLTFQELENFRSVSEYTWQKDAPLKVSMFAWRLFRNSFPTKDNILR